MFLDETAYRTMLEKTRRREDGHFIVWSARHGDPIIRVNHFPIIDQEWIVGILFDGLTTDDIRCVREWRDIDRHDYIEEQMSFLMEVGALIGMTDQARLRIRPT